MADSLLKSAGIGYVTSAKALAAVAFTPEDIDLGDYAFVPFVRTGLAAAIRSAPTANRATVRAAVEIADSADITAKLQAAEQLWIKSRDADCAIAPFPSAPGSKAYTIDQNDCLANKNDERSEFLESIAQE